MQKATLWILGLVIIIGGWYLFAKSDSQAPSEAGTQSQEQEDADIKALAPNAPADAPDVVVDVPQASIPETVVIYTDAGFNPSSVIIKKGQTIRWANNSGSKVWPASAVHPQHGAYPQKSASDCLGSSFDACRGLTQGESWDFKFDNGGVWKFHNHLNASHTGVVNVTE